MCHCTFSIFREKKQLSIKFKFIFHHQRASPCIIPRDLSYYMLPLGWIMKKVMTISMKWRPSWTPSWIFQNAQGWPKSTRRILKIDHPGYPKPSRKNLQWHFPVQPHGSRTKSKASSDQLFTNYFIVNLHHHHPPLPQVLPLLTASLSSSLTIFPNFISLLLLFYLYTHLLLQPNHLILLLSGQHRNGNI